MGVFSVNLHKIILTQDGISGQPLRFGSTSYILGMRKKVAAALAMVGQCWGSANTNIAVIQSFKFCFFACAITSETCGKVGKGNVPEGIKVFQVLWG